MESLLLSRQRQTFSPTFTHTHSSGPTLNHLQMYELLTLLISQAWSKPCKLQRPERAHAKRLFQPSSAETRLKNPAREPIVACFCAKTNIWQIQTEEQSAAKSPKRCKDLGCRCLGNMFGLERELKVCETRLVFILLCVSTE